MSGETRSNVPIRQRFHALMERNFTTSTMSLQQVIAIFIPILLDCSLVSLLSVFNSSMVSSSGAEAVAAVNMVDSLNMFLMNFFMAVATGGTVVVAQYWGRRETDKASESMGQAISGATLIALFIVVFILLFRDQTLGLLFGDAEPAVMENARTYLTGACLSYPFFAIYQAVTGALRGSGDTKAAMVLSVMMNVVYLLFNVIFINWLHMGVLGLVISLNLARGIFSILALLYVFVLRRDLGMKLSHILKLNLRIQKSILYIGIPAALEQIFFNGGKILTQTFIVSLGITSMTSNAIAGSLSGLLYIPTNAMGMAVITCVGQCIGAQRPDEAKKYIRSFVYGSAALEVIFMLIFFPLFPLLLNMYNPPAECVSMIYWLLIICAVGLPTIWPISNIVPSALRAAGDAKFTSFVSLGCMWLFRVVMGYVMGIMLGWDIYGVWIAMVLEWGIRGVIFSIRKRGTKWYAHKLI